MSNRYDRYKDQYYDEYDDDVRRGGKRPHPHREQPDRRRRTKKEFYEFEEEWEDDER